MNKGMEAFVEVYQQKHYWKPNVEGQWEYLYYLLPEHKLDTIETGKIRSVYPLHSNCRKVRPILGSEGQVEAA